MDGAGEGGRLCCRRRGGFMRGWWLSGAMEYPVLAVSWIVWVVFSITLHELAHGWVAMRCGDDVPLRTGHMTFNPFVHIPPMAWVMFALFGFTWGLMPTDPGNYRGRYDDAKVSFAGPAMNLILAVICAVADAVWLKVGVAAGEPLHPNVHTFLWIGTVMNVMGFCFNLVPVPPLDGSRILGDFFPGFRRMWMSEKGAVGVMIAFAVLVMWGSRVVWDIAFGVGTVSTMLGAGLLNAPYLDPFTGKPI